jgi:hypothetical protein
MSKTLEAFRMNKSQMNQIAGGGVRCYVYNRDTQTGAYLNFDGDNVDGIRDTLVNQYGAPHNITCWRVDQSMEIIVDP